MNYTGRTSISDLHEICDDLNLKNVHIVRKHELKKLLSRPNVDLVIVNLDDHGSGSHWVALSRKRKMYFDSYAQPPPLAIPKSYKLASQKKQLQSIQSTDCGALCCLWLYYISHKTNEEYYALFKDVYR